MYLGTACVTHILSVSGLHVGLVLGAVLILAGILRLPHAATAPAASAVLILYAILSGLGPAVIRSTVMALMLLWANHLGRERDWPTTLAAAALVCLFWRPLSLYDTGFQLSFAATWGILYLGPELDRLCQRVTPMPVWLRGTLWVSLAAQLATLPLVAFYYNLVSPVSLVANLVAVPLTGIIMALGAGASLTGLVFPALAGIINAGTSLTLTIFMGLISLVHKLPGGVIFVSTPPLAL
ncbi:ComEC/Rec2 family competence protein, partial [Desulfotomaculum copahuensis]|uniref:ComEC/Rec2 family competence protein n=1 Tax=Desulfotomaculum copahuensis TaxID=1838280 RepID=UPI00124746DF